jgi:hypothetical protein
MAGPAGRWSARERRRGRRRRLALGLTTLLGGSRGFFIPHRYAGAVEPCAYPALDALFAACVPAFDAVLAEIEGHGERLERLGGPAPAPRFDQDWFPTLDAAAAYAWCAGRCGAVSRSSATRPFLAARSGRGAATEMTCIDPAPRATCAALPCAGSRRPEVPQAPETFARLPPATCCSSTRATC